jgi:hypothetical protein
LKNTYNTISNTHKNLLENSLDVKIIYSFVSHIFILGWNERILLLYYRLMNEIVRVHDVNLKNKKIDKEMYIIKYKETIIYN